MSRRSPLEAVTVVFFNFPRLKFFILWPIMKAPLGFHLLGETFGFLFMPLFYQVSWQDRGHFFIIQRKKAQLFEYSGYKHLTISFIYCS
jgi:hypothetical protein